MSEMTEQVLGEEARRAVTVRLWGPNEVGFGGDAGAMARVVVDALQPVVAALVARARAEERKRIAEAATEFCRRCRDEDCAPVERAAVILWGKLLPPEHLGPRCEMHAAEAIGWDALHPGQFEQWAGFDLRPFRPGWGRS